MRLSLGRKDEASSSDSGEGNQHMTEQEETTIRPEPMQSIITISPLEDVVTTVISVSRTPSQNIFDEPQILPPPPAVISESNLSASSMSSSQHHLNQIQQNSISSNVNQVDQNISHTSTTPSRCSRHSKLTIQTLLALSLIVTIGIYTVLIMKFESNIPIFVHVIFVFLIIVEISFIERWYTAQRTYYECEQRPNGANGRLWAPWNDPEFQRRTSLQHSRVAVFDPECPRDFIPPPAYGNLRDSVLIDPNTGRISHHETSQITNVDGDDTGIPPNYDALSVRSSRISVITTEQNANTSYNDSQDSVNV